MGRDPDMGTQRACAYRSGKPARSTHLDDAGVQGMSESEINEGDEVVVERSGQMAKVRRKRVTPTGTMLYGVSYLAKQENVTRDKWRANYSTFCDAYCTRADLRPLLL
jgi:hypothetical protein